MNLSNISQNLCQWSTLEEKLLIWKWKIPQLLIIHLNVATIVCNLNFQQTQKISYHIELQKERESKNLNLTPKATADTPQLPHTTNKTYKWMKSTSWVGFQLTKRVRAFLHRMKILQLFRWCRLIRDLPARGSCSFNTYHMCIHVKTSFYFFFSPYLRVSVGTCNSHMCPTREDILRIRYVIQILNDNLLTTKLYVFALSSFKKTFK